MFFFTQSIILKVSRVAFATYCGDNEYR